MLFQLPDAGAVVAVGIDVLAGGVVERLLGSRHLARVLKTLREVVALQFDDFDDLLGAVNGAFQEHRLGQPVLEHARALLGGADGHLHLFVELGLVVGNFDG